MQRIFRATLSDFAICCNRLIMCAKCVANQLTDLLYHKKMNLSSKELQKTNLLSKNIKKSSYRQEILYSYNN